MTQLQPLDYDTNENSYIMRGNDLRSEKRRPKYVLRKYFLLTGWLIFRTVNLTMLSCDTVNKFISYLKNSGNIKILCMTIKLKFTELEVEVHITKTSYKGYQYFVSLYL